MSGNLGRILAVDDEASVLEVLSEYFGDQGYRVETAADGAEALARLAQSRPDIVLLDVRMPGMDGVEVLKRMRAMDAALPVIMVTANEDVDLARETLKLGAFDYVAKPFDFSYLEQAVTLGLIQSSGGPAAEKGRRGAESVDGPSGVWNALALATFRAVRSMSATARESTGRRMESAALSAANEGAAGRTSTAVASLQELQTLVALAADLEDLTPALRQSVEAAMSAARGSLTVR
jgi:two-component system, response regulator, stage 0 sporulation protein F